MMSANAIKAPKMASKTLINLKTNEKTDPIPFTTKETKLLTPDFDFLRGSIIFNFCEKLLNIIEINSFTAHLEFLSSRFGLWNGGPKNHISDEPDNREKE